MRSNAAKCNTEGLMQRLQLLQCQHEQVQMEQLKELERANKAESELQQERESFKALQESTQQRINALEEMVSTLQRRVDEGSKRLIEEQKKAMEAEKFVWMEQNRAMIAEEKVRVLEKKISDKTQESKTDDAVVEVMKSAASILSRTVETQTVNVAENEALTFAKTLATDVIKRANDRVLLAEERVKLALQFVDEVKTKAEDATNTAKKATEMLHEVRKCTQWTDLHILEQKKKLKHD